MIAQLKKRFNDESQPLMKAISACFPKSPVFLELSNLKSVIDHYKLSEADLKIECIQDKKVFRYIVYNGRRDCRCDQDSTSVKNCISRTPKSVTNCFYIPCN